MLISFALGRAVNKDTIQYNTILWCKEMVYMYFYRIHTYIFEYKSCGFAHDWMYNRCNKKHLFDNYKNKISKWTDICSIDYLSLMMMYTFVIYKCLSFIVCWNLQIFVYPTSSAIPRYMKMGILNLAGHFTKKKTM